MNDLTKLSNEINKKVVGQEHVVKALLIGLLVDGHVLLEGMPGTAKTRSVKALADALSCAFGRIQFTPDLLPSDVTGSEVYRDLDGKPDLQFQEGPIFNSIVLADEINRAPAKVQAALLEAMAEGTVTIGEKTHKLPELFMVLATQNPVEQEGTYPLPEAQMDRFVMKVAVEYPSKSAERDIMRLVRSEEVSGGTVEVQTVNPLKIIEGRSAINKIFVSDVVEEYIVDLVMCTRNPEEYGLTELSDWIASGVSPRATIALDKCSRANAWLAGRDHVTPDDVREVVSGVLNHRIALTYDAAAARVSANDIINTMLKEIPVG
ncbi:AAA family ATPase [Vibrio crassostreae]|uniref:AAA family ATPase n=1 Tax=Vibrio crassostreae TaxID=246167 RepID=UPI001B30F80D|nr:MoxR family ATPase [Vibrio crassostreae]